MQYITDINEVFRILNECCGEPTYKNIGVDEKGIGIAVPCYNFGDTKSQVRQGSAIDG